MDGYTYYGNTKANVVTADVTVNQIVVTKLKRRDNVINHLEFLKEVEKLLI